MDTIIDITMPLHSDMLLYPGSPPFSVEQYRSISSGDTSNNSRFSMGTHVGTMWTLRGIMLTVAPARHG